ncbi:retrovirus-related Pol polyprotein from transposon 412 [Trichonephila clavipes]|nr:retrovirus-related Pol polyprotein from transposon 412 [Trichonephila clavipes]
MDPDIKPLIEFMESSSNKPRWQDISAYSPTTKQGIGPSGILYISGMVFYTEIRIEDGKTFRWQLVLPISYPRGTQKLHGSPTGGHLGVMKTLHRSSRAVFWGKTGSVPFVREEAHVAEAVVQHWISRYEVPLPASFRSGKEISSLSWY